MAWQNQVQQYDALQRKTYKRISRSVDCATSSNRDVLQTPLSACNPLRKSHGRNWRRRGIDGNVWRQESGENYVIYVQDSLPNSGARLGDPSG
jgi:hypothetical protein